MKIRSPKIFYSIKLAVIGIFKNSVLNFASVLVLFSCLVISGTAFLLFLNLNANIESIDSYNKMVVFLDKDTKEERISEIGERLEKLTNIVSVEYVSPDDALAEMIEKYGDFTDLIEMYNDSNPFKPSFRIAYKSASDADNIIYNLDQVPEIVKINSRQDIAKKIEDLRDALTLIFTWVVILLLSISVFVIINTVKASVHARKDEIIIMRYIGATRLFIAGPFVIQGLLIGGFSALAAYFVQSRIYEYFTVEILGNYDILSVIPFDRFATPVLLSFLGIGIVTAVVGSVMSLHYYSKR